MNGTDYAESIRLDKKPVNTELVLERTKALATLHRKVILSNCGIIYMLFWLATQQLYSMFEPGILWQNIVLIVTVFMITLTTWSLIQSYIRGEMSFMSRILGDAIKKVEEEIQK